MSSPHQVSRPFRPRRMHPYLRGFTLVELLAVIAIVAVLAAIIVPVVGKVRSAAKNIKCVSYLREIGTISQLYIADNRGLIPPVKNEDASPPVEWFQYYAGYLGDASASLNYDKRRELLFGCPAYEGGAENPEGIRAWIPGYALNRVPGLPEVGLRNWIQSGSNARRFSINEITHPARRIFFGESSLRSHIAGLADMDTLRHGTHSNALFFDFHVAALPSTAEAVNAAFNGNR